jgi:hypothetical protein
MQIGQAGASSGKTEFKTVGIFSDVSYGLSYGSAPAYVLGRYDAVEISYTDQGTVGVDATGWRVVGNGPHVATGLPYLQDLLSSDYIQLQLVDRQTGVNICKIKDVRVVSYSTGASARGQSTVRVSFVGRVISDEGGNTSTAGAIVEKGFVDNKGVENNLDPLVPAK